MMASQSTKTINLSVAEGVSVTAKVDAPARMRTGTPGLLLAHGANNDLDHPLLAFVAAKLAGEGAALVLRFNFPYAERGSSSPDARPVLENAFRRAHDLLAGELDEAGAGAAPLFLGGKSLGGRFAAEFVSGVAESGALPADGLVVLGYPLHAPGRRDRPNLKPLSAIRVPSLFCEGTRDPFCSPEEIEPILAGLPYPGRLYVVEGGDHSFSLPKSSGRPADDAYEALSAEVVNFVTEASRG